MRPAFPAFTLPAFTRTATFRFTALAGAAFAVSAALVLVFLYAALHTTLAARIDSEITDEITLLGRAYDRGGLNGLNQAVVRRSLDDQDFLYILTYPGGVRLSGSLTGLPAEADQPGEMAQFQYRSGGDDAPDERRFARGYVVEFAGGFRLLVARDFDDEARFLARVAQTSWTATGVILLLALGSGVFVSRRFAHRLEQLNNVVRDVSAGDLHQRAGRTHTNDELDLLAGNLNAMLDRIEHLMAGLRHAGDAIAHDLRSPLTRLRARLEAARSSIAEPAAGDGAATLDAAVGDVDELLTTFDAVMRIARLEAGEKRASLALLDLSALAGDLGELYEPAGEDKDIAIAMDVSRELNIFGDKALLSQAIANLLDNAIKYTPEGGAITLSTQRRRDGRVEVSVTDTGPGIPPDARDKVRQRFVRLDQSRTMPGSGLGLSLVQAVASIHAGELLLEDGPGLINGRGPGLRAALVLSAVEAAPGPMTG